jgi:hypothetical protein
MGGHALTLLNCVQVIDDLCESKIHLYSVKPALRACHAKVLANLLPNSQGLPADYLGIYAHDKLVMKWNAEWDRGNAEVWANPPYKAWENNEWNGKVEDGSGSVWYYKIVWIGGTGADGTLLPNGGYRIWGQFEVMMDQGHRS